ncbi:MAG TPA: hypothetical protein VGC89_22855 [Pyrinomonadaceae bacterium]
MNWLRLANRRARFLLPERRERRNADCEMLSVRFAYNQSARASRDKDTPASLTKAALGLNDQSAITNGVSLSTCSACVKRWPEI